ncbi:ATP-binding protein [Dyadobacter sp. 3J3]|uniref:sensor histidine kinase n=1 Tax=Dyadobacter sp. 3J3 TaxID=2606600 RepID=UPI00135B5B30|nr:ATP-binding protein [Dyadobacter sp. 3J3]
MKTSYKKVSHFCLFLLSGLLISTFATAQKGYHIAHYTSENGLPQNSVKDVSIDKEGFVWLATEDGLVRFDGRNFYVYNRTNLGLYEARVHYIEHSVTKDTSHKNSKETIFAHFANGQVVRIDNGRATLDTTYIPKRLARLKKIGIELGNIIFWSGPRRLWEAQRLNHYLLKAGKKDEDFYFFTDSKLKYFESYQKRYEIDLDKSNLWNYFSLDRSLYWYNEDGSFTELLDKRKTIHPLIGEITSDPSYIQNRKDIKFYYNRNANQIYLYLGKNTYSLELLKDGTFSTHLMIEDFDLVTKGIENIILDPSSKKIYLGSVTEGLYILSRKQFQTLALSGPSRQNSLYAQIPYDDRSILTPNGNILGLEKKTGNIYERHLPFVETRNPFDQRSMFRSVDGSIWLKNEVTLIHTGPGGDTMISYWELPNKIETIHQGKTDYTWMSIPTQGLYRVYTKDVKASWELFLKEYLLDITYIESFDHDNLIIGTKNGLYSIKISSREIKQIRSSAGLHIKSIHVEDNGSAWVTAIGKGVMLLDQKKILTEFPIDQNKYLASPHCAMSDGRGYLWVPTNRGLFQMKIADLLHYAKIKSARSPEGKGRADARNKAVSELFYMYHTEEEGFNTNEFNGSCQPCGVKLKNGYISLPSLNGFVWFRPENINNYSPDGAILLSAAEANRIPITTKGDTLTLPELPQNIRFTFATAYAGNNYNLNLSYKFLKQNDSDGSSDWVPMENNDFSVRYSSLGSGNYTLLVRKLDGFGIDNYTIKKIHIIVPQEWYETAWAIALFATIFLICLILFTNLYSNYRVASAERENRKLEEVIVQRTASLNQALLDVEQSKTEMGKQMHLLSRLVTSITHDIQSPLRYIGFATQRIPGMIENNQLQKASSLGTTISELSDRMGGMLGDLLGYIKVQVYGNRLNSEEINLKKVIDDKLELFKDAIHLNGSIFENDVASGQTVYCDYQFLAIIIHNLIDNAAKYTYHGKIHIYTLPSQDYKLELVISNTGTGVSSELLEMMNKPIKDKNLDELMENGRMTGLGLLMVKEMAELAGITIKVTQTNITSFHLFFN